MSIEIHPLVLEIEKLNEKKAVLEEELEAIKQEELESVSFKVKVSEVIFNLEERSLQIGLNVSNIEEINAHRARFVEEELASTLEFFFVHVEPIDNATEVSHLNYNTGEETLVGVLTTEEIQSLTNSEKNLPNCIKQYIEGFGCKFV